MTIDLTIKKMTIGDVQTALGWAESEGWNPGVADAEAFLAADPDGFYMARRNAEAVAAISVVNHDSENAFLGLYVCRPECRGLGIGYATWQHALEHARRRSVGLDGVPDQQENYRKSGFVRTGQTLRFVGRVPPDRAAITRAAEVADFGLIIEMDAKANGFERSEFMSAWVKSLPSLRATRVLVRDGAIVGFATWRACVEGTKIGPIVAEDCSSALDLIGDIASVRTDGPLIIDVPESNCDLRRELEGAGFDVPFVTARMYRGRVPTTHSSLQSIATMELG